MGHVYIARTISIGETDKEGNLVTFFEQPASYGLSARRGEVGKPGFAEGKQNTRIVPGTVELIAFGGFHVGPPPICLCPKMG
jgi:hypothetical protein